MSDIVTTRPPAATHRQLDEDEFDLVRYVMAVWRARWAILVITLACGGGAFVIGKLSLPVYEASVTLLVSPPKTSLAGEVTPAVSVSTFRAMVDNRTLAQRVVTEFGLDAPPFRLSANTLLANCVTVSAVRDTNLVTLTVRLPSRELPGKVANRFASLAIALSQQLSQDETIQTRDYIKSQMEQSRARLSAAEQELTRFKKEAQIEALRKDVDAQLQQRGDLLALLVNIQAERARLTQAEALLAKRDRVQTVKRTIDRESALTEAARETTRPGSGVLGLELKDEQLDRVYQELDGEIAIIKTKLSGLEKQRAELVDVRRLNSSQLAALSLLYSHESRLATYQTEYDLAKSVYLDVATRYEQVRLQVAAHTAQLQIADPALSPQRPIGPRVLRNAAIATVLGLLLSVMSALLFEAMRLVVARSRQAGSVREP